MFEKSKSFNASLGTAREPAITANRADARAVRRPGDALRAVEWSELTARLNAARDLRVLLRNENQGPIELAAASFGDAAASYFALLDNDEPSVNRDALGQSKALGAKVGSAEANRRGDAKGYHVDAPSGDARELP